MAKQPVEAQQPAPLKRILVAVPSTGGVIKAKTTQTLFQVAAMLTANGFMPTMLNIDGSDVVTVRNLYANHVLKSDKFDALLFVDSDMEFEPRLILRMIALGAGVSGAAYTTRELDLDKLCSAMDEHGDMALARAHVARFNVLKTFDNTKPVVIKKRDGFYSLAAIGMGACLIRKSALQAMVKEGAVEKRIDVRDGVEIESWGFFDMYRLGEVLLLEDYSFCYRWTQLMGRPLWACVDTLVRHIGDFNYGAVYQSVIDSELRPREAAENSETAKAS